jgi:hypothetical protein
LAFRSFCCESSLSECGVAVAKPAGDFLNSLIHRNKYALLSKRLTLRVRSNVIVPSRSSKGRDLETHLDTERVRFLRVGLVTPLPGGLGIGPAGTMTGARGASLQVRAMVRVTPASSRSPEARSELSRGINLRGKCR